MLTIFPAEKDPQKLLHEKIKTGIRQHSSDKYFEFMQIFKPRESWEKSIEEGEESFEASKSVSECVKEELEMDEEAKDLNKDLNFSTKINVKQEIKKNKQVCTPKVQTLTEKSKKGSDIIIKADNSSINSPTPSPPKSPKSPMSPRPKSKSLS